MLGDERRAQVISIDALAPDKVVVTRAVEILRAGGLIVLPTETVYGLTADPRVRGAEERLYEAKGRPAEKAIPRLACDLGQVEESGAKFTPPARRLAERYWPGPLTLVLPCAGRTFGFRVPRFPAAQAVIREAGVPLAVTSANRSGADPALSANEAACTLGEYVELILDSGRSPGGIASTVVRVAGEGWEILREGALTRNAIDETARERPR